MKTKEELTALKAEVEAVNAKLTELTEEELAQVCGGAAVAQLGGAGFPGYIYKFDAEGQRGDTADTQLGRKVIAQVGRNPVAAILE